MACHRRLHNHMAHQHQPQDLVRRCRRMYWMKMEMYALQTSGSPGRIMKHSSMVFWWSKKKNSRPTGQEPVMSTPYSQRRDSDRNYSSMITQPTTPGTPVVTPDRDTHLHRPPPEIRQGYRPAAPIQRFNNKSLNWPAWFRHFRVVADVHGWNKDQRALQLVSYLDETAMNVTQELGDNYDVLVKLLSDRFDPAS